MAVLLGAAALALPALLGMVWLSRARAARRFNAAVATYTEREIDRARRRNGPERARAFHRWGCVARRINPQAVNDPPRRRTGSHEGCRLPGPAAARSEEGEER